MIPLQSMTARLAGIFVACLLLLPMPQARGADNAADRRIVHVLNRLAFGPTVDDFRHVKAIGVERYIAEQLAPSAIAEPFELRWRLAQFDTLNLDAVQLRRLYGPLPSVAGAKPSPEAVTEQRQRARIIVEQAAAARLFRALLSRRQLQEVMVDFWFNHFNVFDEKGLDRVWIGNYEQQAIRPYALGHFRDLLFAVAKHPAMLVYLDNTQNTSPGSSGAHRSENGLNENFAREVMELHTLGVDGGYTQADVTTLARVFTGWSVNRPNARDFPEDAALFVGARHDYGPKVFLGQQLRASGRAEGEEALGMLATSPATAHHIAFELAQYFVADTPPPVLVDQLAARFIDTGGDIRAVLATLFASAEFWDSAGQKYKTPYEFVISAARAAGVPVGNPRPLLGWMAQLGMPLYGCQTPDGYKNTEDAWLSPDAMLRRISFATAFARGALPLGDPNGGAPGDAAPPPPSVPVDAARLEEIFGSILTERTRAAVAQAPPGLRAALILGSPGFMRR